MKGRIILAALLLVAGMQTVVAQSVVLYKSNGQTIEYEVEELDSIVFKEKVPKLVTSIVLSETSITLQPDETKRLTATVLPSDAANPAVTWSSSDENVAAVISNGLVVAIANGSCVVTCSATDGSGVKAECLVRVGVAPIPEPGDHEYVDLGLPSGTLWATCNVGASSPEEYGDYFAWGETSPKSEYNMSTYKWMNAGQSSWGQINKYTFADGQTSACWYDADGNFIGDRKTELDPADDAATANWDSGWQMPSLAQIQELLDNCTRELTTQGGVNGTLVTGPNGNTLFLPAAGYRDDASLSHAGSGGYYWSRSLGADYSDYACYLRFYSGGVDWCSSGRHFGQSVRPVRVK